MESISPLRDNDVLFGRGKGPQYHPGNVAFRALVDSRKADYWSDNQEVGHKTQLANEVYEAIVSPKESDQSGGRFLRQEDDMNVVGAELQAGRSVSTYGGKYYIEVPRKVAVEKCKMALRQKVNAADQREARRRRKRLSTSNGTEKAAAGSGSSAVVAAVSSGTNINSEDVRPDQISSAASAMMGGKTSSSLDELDLPAGLDSLQFLDADLDMLPLDDSTSRPLPSHHVDDVNNERNASNAGKAAGTSHPTTTANVGAGGLQDVNRGTTDPDQIPDQSSTEPTRTTPLCDGIQDLSLGGGGDPGDPVGDGLSSVVETALISVRMYQSALEAADGFDANSLGRILYDVFADASEGSDSTKRLTKPSSRADGGAGPAKRDRRNTASYQPLVAFGYPASLSHVVDFLLGQTPSEIFYTSSAEVESDLRGILRTKIGDDEVNETSQVGGRLYFDDGQIFGREEELRTMFSAYHCVRDRKETRTFVSISGYSGTGKTSLVNQLGRRLLEDNESLIRCNFTEQGQSTAALFKAFDEYFRHLSDSDDQEWVGQIRRNVRNTLGSNSHVLFGCLPSLRSFLGEEPSSPPAAADNKEEAMNQILFYFFKFVRAISGPEHPLVFVLDDIQWCNENTLELVKSMLRDTGIASALFIGCYRDEEVGDDHCFADLFGELAMEESLPLVSITLQNVDADGVNAIVSSVLHLNPRFTRPLAEVLHHKTQGNPMFVRQLLLSLVDDGLLVFSAIGRRWTWELRAIAAKPISNNSVSFMIGMMKTYPEGMQNTLRLAALLGTSCRQDLLEKLLRTYGYGERYDIAECVENAATLGVLMPDGSGVLCFSHDQLFQAARALTPSQEQPCAHLDIGRRLLKSSDGALNSLSPGFLTTIVDQYNEGISLITDHEEELVLAELNLLAGEAALASASYLQAAIYLLRGCGLVIEDDWNNRYNTCLRLYTFSGEAQITQGMVGGSIIAAKEVLKHGRSFNDKLPAHQALLTAYTINGNVTDAIQHGISVLMELGEDFPIDRNEQRASSEAELVRVCGMLKSKSFDDIVNQSIIRNDYTEIFTMQVLMVVTRIAYLNDPMLMLVLVFRMVSKSMTSGLTAEASFAFAALSFVLCGLGQYELSSFSARVATALLQKFEQKYSHIVHVLLNCSILPYSQPQQACVERLYAAYEDAMSVGAVEWGLANLARSLQASLFAPDRNSSLQDYFERIVKANAVFVSLKHHMFVLYNLYLLHAIPSLMSGDGTSNPLSSLTLSEEILEPFDQKARDHVMRRSITLHVWFSCLFGVYTDAKKRVDDVLRIMKMNPFAPSFDTYNECFYAALIAFALLRKGDTDKSYWECIAADVMEKLNTWAAIGSGWNLKSKMSMLNAEQAFYRGDFDAARASYFQAAHKARETGFIHEEALACELAGDFHCTRGELLEGRAYLQRSIELYTRWGAHRKAIHVRKRLLSFEQVSK